MVQEDDQQSITSLQKQPKDMSSLYESLLLDRKSSVYVTLL